MLNQKLHTKSDNELLSLYNRKNDPEIIGVLFKRYTGFVFAISLKYLKDEDSAKDAVMGIFEELFEKLLKHKVSNFKSWLHTLTRNYCLLQLRAVQYSESKTRKFGEEQNSFMEDEEFLHQQNDWIEGKLQIMEMCIPKLKPEQKQCITLFYLEKKSYVEITEITGYNLKKVKSYIQNGKRNLKIMMDSYNE